MIVEHRLELELADGVAVYVLETADYDRCWQLRRDGEVLAETELEDHAAAREWIAALQGGEIPSVRDAGFGIHHPVHPSATPRPTPDSELNEPQQETLLQ